MDSREEAIDTIMEPPRRIACLECLGKGYFLLVGFVRDGIQHLGIVPDLHSYRTCEDLRYIGREACHACGGTAFIELSEVCHA